MGRPAPGRATVDGMAWLVLLAICSAYGVFAFTWLAGFHVPAGRAAAAGAWSTPLASTAILVGAVLLLARSRAAAGWLVALAAATALVVPFAVLDTLSGGLPA